MAVLEVIKMGNPLLRKVSEAVSIDEINTPDFQTFLDHLIATMHAHQGAGIAAPQVGVLKRAFAMEMAMNERYPNKEPFPLYTIINPEITPFSDEKIPSWEGCLSIPNIRGRLQRHAEILLSGLDRNGHAFKTHLKGFAAIVAQHEVDHLNGILLIDQMESMETLSFQEEYEKYWL